MRLWPRRQSRGVIYCATGAGYLDLALRSAESCRAAMPGLPIDLFTDRPVDHPALDRVVVLTNPAHRSKLDAMAATRFDLTVFLDADTHIRHSFDAIFDLLARFEMCGAHDPIPNSWLGQAIWRAPVPDSFPQINTGVLGFRKTRRVHRFLRRWAGFVRGGGLAKDQAVFRELLWHSNLRFAVLPKDYNFLTVWGLQAMLVKEAAPRILHVPEMNRHIKKPGQEPRPIEAILKPGQWQKLQAMDALAERIRRDRKRRLRLGNHRHASPDSES